MKRSDNRDDNDYANEQELHSISFHKQDSASATVKQEEE
jgi:hypothetical protein